MQDEDLSPSRHPEYDAGNTGLPCAVEAEKNPIKVAGEEKAKQEAEGKAIKEIEEETAKKVYKLFV